MQVVFVFKKVVFILDKAVVDLDDIVDECRVAKLSVYPVRISIACNLPGSLGKY